MLNSTKSKQRFVSILRDALLSEAPLNFFIKAIKLSYVEFYHEHATELNNMIDQSVSLLRDSQKDGESVEKLYQAVERAKSECFKKGDNLYWFNSAYAKYKVDIRPKKDLKLIGEFIKGKKILDLGSGGGYLAMELTKRGFDVTMTDVLDYRVPQALSIPFKKMESPSTIPFPTDYFDCIIVKTVLHHVDEENIPKLISEIARVARRVIVEEDTYCLEESMPQLADMQKEQPLLKEFCGMSCEDQKKSLALLDYFANAIALGSLGVPEINFTFQFKPVEEWKKLFGVQKLILKHTKLFGFSEGKMHKNCQVWMIYDRG